MDKPQGQVMRQTLKGMVIGGVLAALGFSAFNAARYLYQVPEPSQQATDHSLTPIQIPPSWIKSGKPTFLYTQYASSPDGKTATGIWSCEGPATFEWQFGSDEVVHVLDGRVEIDYLGQHFVLEPGSTAFFQAETRAVWHVPKYMRKSFTLYHPNRPVRWVRKLLRLWDQEEIHPGSTPASS